MLNATSKSGVVRFCGLSSVGKYFTSTGVKLETNHLLRVKGAAKTGIWAAGGAGGAISKNSKTGDEAARAG